ncbi:DUF551 domain-containing protein [[Ruminococcus] lactaris]|uniref:DUF551 domain-containing protein n=1 Tax=[Ruminococcus] lactaris TaxID=46228 RepID=UPI003967AD50
MDVEKTKVESLDIIVTMMEDKPYYGIKYKEVGSDHFCIGYSSYRLDYVLEWKKQYFELVEREAGADQGWIPCSERLPENAMNVIAQFSDGTVTELRYAGNGIFEGIYEYSTRVIIAWMPLPEPYKGE